MNDAEGFAETARVKSMAGFIVTVLTDVAFSPFELFKTVTVWLLPVIPDNVLNVMEVLVLATMSLARTQARLVIQTLCRVRALTLSATTTQLPPTTPSPWATISQLPLALMARWALVMPRQW